MEQFANSFVITLVHQDVLYFFWTFIGTRIIYQVLIGPTINSKSSSFEQTTSCSKKGGRIHKEVVSNKRIN